MRNSLKQTLVAVVTLAMAMGMLLALATPASAQTDDDYGSSAPVTVFVDASPTGDEILAEIQARAAAEAEAAAAADEVLGTAIPASPPLALPAPEIAFSGSNVDMPLALGAALIGSGGLLVLAARKKERQL